MSTRNAPKNEKNSKNNIGKNGKGKSAKGKGKQPEKQPTRGALRREIVAIIVIAAAVMVLISLFMEDAGLIGRLVNSLLLGLFGTGAYFLPFAALIYGGILLINKKEMLRPSKIVMGSAVFLLSISILHMIGSDRPEDISIWAYIGYIYLNGGVGNGGLLGAATSRLFIAAISEIGTYILFITAAAVLLIQITGRSLFDLLQGMYLSARQGIAEKREERRESIEEYAEAEYYEEEYAYDADQDNYKYVSPPKKAHNVILNDNGYDDVKIKDGGNISLIKDELIGKSREQKLAPRPKSPKNLLLEDTAGEPPWEAEEQEQNEDNFDDVTINVKGIVEGYRPSAVSLENIEPDSFVSTSVDTLQPQSKIAQAAPAEDKNDWDGIVCKDSKEDAEYIFPPVELLRENTYQPSLSSRAQILENSKKLEETLQSFGVAAKVVEVSKGPTVTRYELSPGSGVKVSKISGLADDLALNLAASGIRIEAPIPGKSVVGIEIPNKDVQAVYLREVIDDEVFWDYPSKLSFAMGKDIAGNTVIADISKMPHLLIAGATGAGKSVCINTLIASIIYKASPSEVKLLMIDPKVVELSVYNGIPHLLIPVVTDPKKASGALAWGVREMDNRYNMFAETRVRDLAGYNSHLSEQGADKLPQIVIIIDELADLMMTCGKEVEESICRLAQKARAAGIHLIIATQRPSVDVITGLIKANVPSRLAFAVSSGTDSRTILDMTGAEKLLGKGDMLFSPVGLSKPQRIQGSFISDKEVENIVNFIKQDVEIEYSEEMIDQITSMPESSEFSEDSDPLIEEAVAFIVEREKASTSMLQRRFRIGYNRAARMMEELVAKGLVGPEDGAKPRKVLMTQYQYREHLEARKQRAEQI